MCPVYATARIITEKEISKRLVPWSKSHVKLHGLAQSGRHVVNSLGSFRFQWTWRSKTAYRSARCCAFSTCAQPSTAQVLNSKSIGFTSCHGRVTPRWHELRHEVTCFRSARFVQVHCSTCNRGLHTRVLIMSSHAFVHVQSKSP